MDFKCKYCKVTNSSQSWDEQTIRECGEIDKGIEEGYNNINYYYICPECGEKSYKRDWTPDLLIDTELIQKALTVAGYNCEPTEQNLRECFGDYVDSRIWSNVEQEDVQEMTITEMCQGLLSLK
jgi:hypothetical protein